MIYLIEHLLWFLIFTGVFAAVAGAAWHGLRTQARLDALAAERARLLRNLAEAGIENGAGAAPSPELERQMEALRLRADMAQARATEAERAAEGHRARADEAHARIAELDRTGAGAGPQDSEELARLREQVAAHEAQSRAILDVEAAPVDDESVAQSWRLRYFEQRVRYLEGQSQVQAQAAAPAPAPAAPAPDHRPDHAMEWRARLAEARANHLENELRAAAPAETDADRAGWRMRYLEKRVEHFAGEAAAPAEPDESDEAALLKWRARYLEARVRHLEANAAAGAAQPGPAPAIAADAAPPAPEPSASEAVASEPAPPTPAPLVPAGQEERPAALPAAQMGAPDDLTLIEGVSHMQQSTLNALGVYHFEQIAAWTPANVAWVDQYLRLRGRIVSEHWLDQADALAREGPMAAARRLQEEPA